MKFKSIVGKAWRMGWLEGDVDLKEKLTWRSSWLELRSSWLEERLAVASPLGSQPLRPISFLKRTEPYCPLSPVIKDCHSVDDAECFLKGLLFITLIYTCRSRSGAWRKRSWFTSCSFTFIVTFIVGPPFWKWQISVPLLEKSRFRISN